jgi:hypothetical protein
MIRQGNRDVNGQRVPKIPGGCGPFCAALTKNRLVVIFSPEAIDRWSVLEYTALEKYGGEATVPLNPFL